MLTSKLFMLPIVREQTNVFRQCARTEEATATAQLCEEFGGRGWEGNYRSSVDAREPQIPTYSEEYQRGKG
eukprot:1177158-Prorocentrum_minimum.AAC.1